MYAYEAVEFSLAGIPFYPSALNRLYKQHLANFDAEIIVLPKINLVDWE